jgi:hypothetical protein
MSAKYKSPSFLLPNELNTSANPANDTGINSLYSMDFSGSGDKIQTGLTPPLGDSSRSISLWFYTSNSSSHNMCGYGAASQVSGHNGFDILTTTNNYVGTHLYGTAIIAGGTYNLNAWNHYVITYDGTTLQGYLNGVAVDSNNTEVVNTLSTNNFIIGEGVYTGFNGFSGKIDEVAIFNRALDSTEIAALYGGTSPNIYPSNLMASNLNPIAYYPLGEQAQNSGKLPDTSTNEWQFPNGVLQDYVMDFNGGDNISSSLSLNGASSFTVSVWFNPTTLSGSKYILGQWQDGDQSNSTWAIATVGTLLYFFIQDNTGTKVISTNQSTGVWTNAIAIYTGSSIKLYVNNILINTVSAGSLNSGSKSFRIGDDFNGGNGFDGKISNVAIWNTDQSTNKDNIYNNGSPQTSYTVSPQNWWKLNADSVYTPSVASYSKALDFGGTDYIDCGVVSAVENVSSFSMSVWVYPTNGASKSIIGNWGNPYVGVQISTSTSQVNFFVDDSTTGSGYGSTSTGLSNNNWAHLVLVFDGSGSGNSGRLKGYINGVEQTLSYTGTIAATTAAPNRAFRIGDQHLGNGLIGNISNAAIWNTPLSASQVSTLFNFGTPETNISFSPISWWKLDNLTTGIQDSGSASNNGTNNGTTQVNTSVAVVPSWKIPTALTIPTINYTSALKLVGGTSSNPGESMAFASTISTTSTTSFSMWLKTTTTSNQYILTYLPSAPNGILFRNGKIYFFDIPAINATSYPQSNDISSTLADGNWHHLVVTRDNKNVKFYLDKNDVSTSTTFNLDFNSFDITHFGKASSNHGIDWNGEVSNLAIFNFVLSQANVETLYNNGQPQDNISFTPTHWWKLNSINGTTVTDTNGSNNGTTSGSIETTDVKTSDLNIPVNGVSTTLPNTALQQSDLQFDSPYSNYSLNFDGNGDYIEASGSNLPTGNSSFTASCWFKRNGTQANYAGILSWGTASQRENVYINFAPNGTSLKFGFYSDDLASSGYYATSNNVWYNVVLTYNGSVAKMYINGSLQASHTLGGALNISNSNPLTIGKTNTYHFNGEIDETSIFNYSLSEAQVLEVYNNGRPKDLTTFSGTAPISWWRLGENAYFDNNSFVVPNSISGAPNGTGAGTVTSMISADAPGTYANGVGTNLDIVDRVGDAALSTSNSQSYNMIPSDISPYVPQYVGDQIANNFSMTFDGVDDYFDGGISSIFNLQGSFSVSLWVNSSSFQNYVHLLSKLDTSYTGWRIQLDQTNVRIQTSNMSGGITVAKNMNTATWYHMCFTYDGTYLNYYQNGSNAISNNTSFVSPPSSNNNNFRIGKSGLTDAGGAAHNGQIDEVAIFDTALNAGQIYNDIYQPTATGTNQTADLVNNPNLPNPVAWYRMGD